MFELYFQSGEFVGESGGFWTDLMVQIIGTGIGAILAAKFALTLYRKQYNDQKIAKELDQNHFDREKVLYLNSLLTDSYSYADSVVAGITTTVAQWEDNNFIMADITAWTPNDLIRLVDKIDRDVHFHSYRRVMKDDNVLRLFKSVDAINFAREDVGKEWRIAIENSNRNKRAVEQNAEQIFKFFPTITSDDSLGHEFKSRISEILLNYLAPTPANVRMDLIGRKYQRLLESFYQPLAAAIGNDNIFGVSNRTKLLILCRDGQFHINGIVQGNQNLVNELNYLQTKFQENSDIVKVGVAAIENELSKPGLTKQSIPFSDAKPFEKA